NARPGGRAGIIEEQGFRFDTGPSWFLMREVFDHFFELLGTSTDAQLDLRLLDPGYQVFSEPDAIDGRRRITVPHRIDAVAEVSESRRPGAGAAVRKYVKSAGRAAGLALKRFLYAPFTRVSSGFGRDVLRDSPALLRLLSTSLEKSIDKRFA